MQVSGGVVCEPAEFASAGLVHLQELRDGHTARTRGRSREHAVVAPAEVDGIAPNGAIARQVRRGDEPAATRHLLSNELGRAASVELIGSGVCNALEGVGQDRLPKTAGGCKRCEVGREVRAGETWKRLLRVCGKPRINRESAPGEVDGRCQQLGPRSGAVTLVGGPQAGDRSGHAGSPMADQARIRVRLAVRAEIHVARRRSRGRLPVVQKGAFALDEDRS